jgi:hypothetical protein
VKAEEVEEEEVEEEEVEEESEQEVEELNIENLETADLESVSGDFDDHIGLEEVSMVESTETKEEPKEEAKEELKEETKEEAKEEQKKEPKEEHNEDYLTNVELLNGMSLKQLRDISEKYNLGSRGSKEQLLAKIKRNIAMKN